MHDVGARVLHDAVIGTGGAGWVQLALAALNVVQTIALAYLAAAYRRNGKA